jgi:hypothetical protein
MEKTEEKEAVESFYTVFRLKPDTNIFTHCFVCSTPTRRDGTFIPCESCYARFYCSEACRFRDLEMFDHGADCMKCTEELKKQVKNFFLARYVHLPQILDYLPDAIGYGENDKDFALNAFDQALTARCHSAMASIGFGTVPDLKERQQCLMLHGHIQAAIMRERVLLEDTAQLAFDADKRLAFLESRAVQINAELAALDANEEEEEEEDEEEEDAPIELDIMAEVVAQQIVESFHHSSRQAVQAEIEKQESEEAMIVLRRSYETGLVRMYQEIATKLTLEVANKTTTTPPPPPPPTFLTGIPFGADSDLEDDSSDDSDSADEGHRDRQKQKQRAREQAAVKKGAASHDADDDDSDHMDVDPKHSLKRGRSAAGIDNGNEPPLAKRARLEKTADAIEKRIVQEKHARSQNAYSVSSSPSSVEEEEEEEQRPPHRKGPRPLPPPPLPTAVEPAPSVVPVTPLNMLPTRNNNNREKGKSDGGQRGARAVVTNVDDVPLFTNDKPEWKRRREQEEAAAATPFKERLVQFFGDNWQGILLGGIAAVVAATAIASAFANTPNGHPEPNGMGMVETALLDQVTAARDEIRHDSPTQLIGQARLNGKILRTLDDLRAEKTKRLDTLVHHIYTGNMTCSGKQELINAGILHEDGKTWNINTDRGWTGEEVAEGFSSLFPINGVQIAPDDILSSHGNHIAKAIVTGTDNNMRICHIGMENSQRMGKLVSNSTTLDMAAATNRGAVAFGMRVAVQSMMEAAHSLFRLPLEWIRNRAERDIEKGGSSEGSTTKAQIIFEVIAFFPSEGDFAFDVIEWIILVAINIPRVVADLILKTNTSPPVLKISHIQTLKKVYRFINHGFWLSNVLIYVCGIVPMRTVVDIFTQYTTTAVSTFFTNLWAAIPSIYNLAKDYDGIASFATAMLTPEVATRLAIPGLLVALFGVDKYFGLGIFARLRHLTMFLPLYMRQTYQCVVQVPNLYGHYARVPISLQTSLLTKYAVYWTRWLGQTTPSVSAWTTFTFWYSSLAAMITMDTDTLNNFVYPINSTLPQQLVFRFVFLEAGNAIKGGRRRDALEYPPAQPSSSVTIEEVTDEEEEEEAETESIPPPAPPKVTLESPETSFEAEVQKLEQQETRLRDGLLKAIEALATVPGTGWSQADVQRVRDLLEALFKEVSSMAHLQTLSVVLQARVPNKLLQEVGVRIARIMQQLIVLLLRSVDAVEVKSISRLPVQWQQKLTQVHRDPLTLPVLHDALELLYEAFKDEGAGDIPLGGWIDRVAPAAGPHRRTLARVIETLRVSMTWTMVLAGFVYLPREVSAMAVAETISSSNSSDVAVVTGTGLANQSDMKLAFLREGKHYHALPAIESEILDYVLMYARAYMGAADADARRIIYKVLAPDLKIMLESTPRSLGILETYLAASTGYNARLSMAKQSSGALFGNTVRYFLIYTDDPTTLDLRTQEFRSVWNTAVDNMTVDSLTGPQALDAYVSAHLTTGGIYRPADQQQQQRPFEPEKEAAAAASVENNNTQTCVPCDNTTVCSTTPPGFNVQHDTIVQTLIALSLGETVISSADYALEYLLLDVLHKGDRVDKKYIEIWESWNPVVGFGMDKAVGTTFSLIYRFGRASAYIGLLYALSVACTGDVWGGFVGNTKYAAYTYLAEAMAMVVNDVATIRARGTSRDLYGTSEYHLKKPSLVATTMRDVSACIASMSKIARDIILVKQLSGVDSAYLLMGRVMSSVYRMYDGIRHPMTYLFLNNAQQAAVVAGGLTVAAAAGLYIGQDLALLVAAGTVSPLLDLIKFWNETPYQRKLRRDALPPGVTPAVTHRVLFGNPTNESPGYEEERLAYLRRLAAEAPAGKVNADHVATLNRQRFVALNGGYETLPPLLDKILSSMPYALRHELPDVYE